ncbi:MAG: carboxypeptidase regulatory-like domain-containing protein [Acidobacteria bacterium]|nr:carboxypeptidase regulatory-like domain-containing protein [Acidobacteriota bacterium]
MGPVNSSAVRPLARVVWRPWALAILAAMAFLLPLWLASAAAARLPGTLSGTVFGPSGKAVAAARVFLQVSDGSHPHTTKTDAHGHFRFGGLRQGNYDIRAQAQGHWSDWEHNVLVRSGRESRVNLRLLLKQPPAGPPRAPAVKPAPQKPTQ